MVFLDIEKAYDTVDRRKLVDLLKHVGVQDKMVKVIENMYEENLKNNQVFEKFNYTNYYIRYWSCPNKIEPMKFKKNCLLCSEINFSRFSKVELFGSNFSIILRFR